MIVDPKNFKLQAKPAFIVFEGVNGAGKSTLAKGVRAHLEKMGKKITTTFEPGDSELGKKIREIFFSESKKPRSSMAELFLFLSDRAQHVSEVIEPALREGNYVLCDRYLYSTIAFQGHAEGLDLGVLTSLNDIAIQGRIPDLVILLDLPAEIGLERAQVRAATGDQFEKKPLSYHVRVRDGFLDLAQKRPEPFLVLDSLKSPEELINQVIQVF